jgi:ATP-dependent DNA helicase RecG
MLRSTVTESGVEINKPPTHQARKPPLPDPESFVAEIIHLGFRGLEDLLFDLPLRYEDETRISPIGTLVPGQSALVEGEVELADIRYRPGRQLLCRIADGSGHLHLRFFHFYHSQYTGFKRGLKIRAYGTLREGGLGREFVHPRYRVFKGSLPPLKRNLTAIYSKRAGVESRHQERLISMALDLMEQKQLELPDHLPPALTRPWVSCSLREALRGVHQPPAGLPPESLENWLKPYQRRLAFEELLAHALSLQKIRMVWERARSHPLSIPAKPLAQFLKTLPWELTGAQQRTWREIEYDLSRAKPMLRLLQGDVGSGKTLLAILAAWATLANRGQVAVMVPTELLADQHYTTFQRFLSPLGEPILRLASRSPKSQRRPILECLAGETPCVVIGTQNLFQSEVVFGRLTTVIIDEQHRFGVEQRLDLVNKGARIRPHQLIMTATPIPRTLAMSLYAGLDQSRLDELPPGRQGISTSIFPAERRGEIMSRLQVLCEKGQRIFWVCPRIEENEGPGGRAAKTAFEDLRKALPHLPVGLLHGRISGPERQQIIEGFRGGRIQILVSTTVVEVGVDIPEATVMVVDGADRLGLLQLHQLRGRVGRGAQPGQCLLIYETLSPDARSRLEVMRQSNDGFWIAERDLEIRGPGEIWGARQSGGLSFRIAQLYRDRDLLALIPEATQRLSKENPESIEPLVARWIGGDLRFGSA